MTADAAQLAAEIGLLALAFVLSEERPEEPCYWAGGTCGNVFAVLRDLGWQSAPISSAMSSKLLSLGALLAAYGLSQWRRGGSPD